MEMLGIMPRQASPCSPLRVVPDLSKEQGVQGLGPLLCVAESGRRGDRGLIFFERNGAIGLVCARRPSRPDFLLE